MQAVEFEKVRGDRGAALDLVDVNDVEPVARARIVVGPIHRAERRAQGEPADPAHAIDPDPHRSAPPVAGERRRPGLRRFHRAGLFSAIRSSVAKGKLMKIMMRR